MAYITENDLLELFGLEAYNDDENGVPSETRITAAIAVVEAEVDAYLMSGGYTVPFTGSGLKGRIADWVRYRLADDQGTVTDNIERRYLAAVEFFQRIGSGALQLEVSDRKQIASASVTRT